MNKSNFLFFLILITFVVSCKTTRNIAKKEVTTDTINTLIKNVQLTQPVFKTANVSKMGLIINFNSRKINVAASCKIKKDSAIFVSVQPMFGIELFKAEITPDSILIFDKMNRTLYAVSYTYLKSKLGINVNYFNIQALISNQLFCVGKREISSKGWSFNKLSNGKTEIGFEVDRLNQKTLVTENYQIEKVLIGAADFKYELTTEYTNFQLADSINFPMKINISANSLRTKFSCDFNIAKVQFNSDFTLTTSEKNNYSRANIDQFFKK
ncbi:MAG: DUF4292 domain-containing protein [Paludibacter sp.]|nr:DUF4292 domain-containing protein [Paludibacter sp.]